MNGLDRLMIAALGLALMVAPAWAKDTASARAVAAGRKIAMDNCSNCHVVAADQDIPPILKQKTPSFAELANAPGVSAQSLRRFIGATHWDEHTVPVTMPNPMLSSEQKSDVVAYILSLRTHP